MTLYDKIMTLYPNLKPESFNTFNGVIILQNDSDGRGDYIAKWEHPDYPEPTKEQLDGIE